MSTMKDVAKKAGVSMMTVSRVINTPDKVKEPTLRKVQAAMESLHFKPNTAARALASNQTRTIHVFIQSIISTHDPYLMALLAGISEVLSASYYSFLIRRDWEFPYRCDGVIALSSDEDLTKKIMKTIDEPVVLFGKTKEPLDWVDFDHYQGTYIMTSHILGKGHHEIGYIGIGTGEAFAFERQHGFLDALRDAGLPINPKYICNVKHHTEQAGFESALSLLKANHITSLVCASDVLALGAITAARTLGLRVPEDLSIGGFDGLFFDQMASPPLTTILQPVHLIGEELARQLIHRIQDPEQAPIRKLIPPELIERSTVCERKKF